MINDKMVSNVPRWLSKAVASNATSRSSKWLRRIGAASQNQSHPLDWKIEYRKLSEEAFEIDIQPARSSSFPASWARRSAAGICRMDYLFANRLGNGFTRTKTLGDGDDCCNCHYELVGKLRLAPETGFTDRK